MTLVNTAHLLREASARHYCVGAFNIVDYLTMEAVVCAAVESHSPVIIASSASVVRRHGIQNLVSMAQILAAPAAVPVGLHLDHGTDPAMIQACIEGGYTSVMIDASHHPFAENVRRTREVVEAAHRHGVAVEGEIGLIAGVEDDLVVSEDQAIYTTPDEAIAFQKQTGVDFLAAAIGTAHGFYKKTPRLDIDTLRAIHAAIDVPLVIHGGSGLDADVIQELVAAGGAKMNVSTQLKQTYLDALHGYIEAYRAEYDPLRVLGHARQELVKMMKRYMLIWGSEGQADG